MPENEEDFGFNLLTNTSCSGTKLPSTIYLVDATKTNDSSAHLTTYGYSNYYYVLAQDERSNADTEIVHPNQISPYVPSRGGIWWFMTIPTYMLLLTTSFDIILRENSDIFLTTFRL